MILRYFSPCVRARTAAIKNCLLQTPLEPSTTLDLRSLNRQLKEVTRSLARLRPVTPEPLHKDEIAEVRQLNNPFIQLLDSEIQRTSDQIAFYKSESKLRAQKPSKVKRQGRRGSRLKGGGRGEPGLLRVVGTQKALWMEVGEY